MQHMLADYLAQHDIRAAAALQRQEVARQFAVAEPDVVILDLRLGTEDGLDLLRELRSRSDVPVIITTGHRRDEVDRVVGLELGADDYITKPFSARELLALGPGGYGDEGSFQGAAGFGAEATSVNCARPVPSSPSGLRDLNGGSSAVEPEPSTRGRARRRSAASACRTRA